MIFFLLNWHTWVLLGKSVGAIAMIVGNNIIWMELGTINSNLSAIWNISLFQS